MAPSYLHGIETIEVPYNGGAITTVATGIIGLIGTAPDRDTTKYPINTPFLIPGDPTAAAPFGTTGTIPEALNCIFDVIGATIVVVVIEEGTSTDAAIQRLQTYANLVGNPETKTGVHAFRSSNAVLQLIPKLIIAPGFTSERPEDGISGAAVNTGGQSYTQANTTAQIVGGGGQGATLTVDVGGSGSIQALLLGNKGVGYKTGTAPATGNFKFTAQPTVGDVLSLNGTHVAFIANGATATGNQVPLGVTLAATMTALAAFLNGSQDAQISLNQYTAGAAEIDLVSVAQSETANGFTLAATSATAGNVKVSGPTMTGGYSALRVVITGDGTGATGSVEIGQVANPVAVELNALVPDLRAMAIVDTQGTSYADAVAYEGDFDSQRIKLVEGFFQRFDSSEAANVVVPAAPYAAAMQALMDNTNGFWWDFSNQPVPGVVGVGRPIDWSYFDSNVEGQLLNSKNIAVCVHDSGFKIMGVRVPSSDSEWIFWSVRRTADAVYESIEDALRTAIDRPISLGLIEWIELQVNQYLGLLKQRGAILDGRAWLDPNANSAADLQQGHLTINFDLEPPAPLERLTFQAMRNNGYYTELVSAVLSSAVNATGTSTVSNTVVAA